MSECEVNIVYPFDRLESVANKRNDIENILNSNSRPAIEEIRLAFVEYQERVEDFSQECTLCLENKFVGPNALKKFRNWCCKHFIEITRFKVRISKYLTATREINDDELIENSTQKREANSPISEAAYTSAISTNPRTLSLRKQLAIERATYIAEETVRTERREAEWRLFTAEVAAQHAELGSQQGSQATKAILDEQITLKYLEIQKNLKYHKVLFQEIENIENGTQQYQEQPTLQTCVNFSDVNNLFDKNDIPALSDKINDCDKNDIPALSDKINDSHKSVKNEFEIVNNDIVNNNYIASGDEVQEICRKKVDSSLTRADQEKDSEIVKCMICKKTNHDLANCLFLQAKPFEEKQEEFITKNSLCFEQGALLDRVRCKTCEKAYPTVLRGEKHDASKDRGKKFENPDDKNEPLVKEVNSCSSGSHSGAGLNMLFPAIQMKQRVKNLEESSQTVFSETHFKETLPSNKEDATKEKGIEDQTYLKNAPFNIVVKENSTLQLNFQDFNTKSEEVCTQELEATEWKSQVSSVGVVKWNQMVGLALKKLEHKSGEVRSFNNDQNHALPELNFGRYNFLADLQFYWNEKGFAHKAVAHLGKLKSEKRTLVQSDAFNKTIFKKVWLLAHKIFENG